MDDTRGIPAGKGFAAAALQDLLFRPLRSSADRLDLLEACGRRAHELDPLGESIPGEIGLGARRSLGRPIDAAECIPDLEHTAGLLAQLWRRPDRSLMEREACLRVDERVCIAFALRGIEALWPDDRERVHWFVRRRRGLCRYDDELARVRPWRVTETAVAPLRDAARTAGLRPSLFGPLAAAAEPWSALHLALYGDASPSPASWHAAIVRILEADWPSDDQERALNDACLDLVRLVAADPLLPADGAGRRWRRVLRMRAAEFAPGTPASMALDLDRLDAGIRAWKEQRLPARAGTVGARALALARRATADRRPERDRPSAQRLLVSVAADPGADRLRLAAGDADLEPEPLLLSAGSVKVAIAPDQDRRLVATIEVRRDPLRGADVTLLTGDEPKSVLGRGVTDERGEVILGNYEGLAPALARGWTLRIEVPHA